VPSALSTFFSLFLPPHVKRIKIIRFVMRLYIE
jgi:hypothetical protein